MTSPTEQLLARLRQERMGIAQACVLFGVHTVRAALEAGLVVEARDRLLQVGDPR